MNDDVMSGDFSSMHVSFSNRYADKYELNVSNIAINYLKSWFLIDLLSTLPLNYIVSAATSQRYFKKLAAISNDF